MLPLVFTHGYSLWEITKLAGIYIQEKKQTAIVPKVVILHQAQSKSLISLTKGISCFIQSNHSVDTL